MSNLRLRVISAVVLAAVSLPAVWIGGLAYVVLVTAISCIVWQEWIAMNATGSDDRLLLVGIAFVAAAGICAIVLAGNAFLLAIVALWMIGTSIVIVMGGGLPAASGLTYCLLALASLTQLRGDAGSMAGLGATAFLFGVVWSTDIAAYFTGRAIGGPKLAPRISPGKTVSGAIGGLVGAVAAALLVRAVFEPSATIMFMIVLALVASVISQFGDLFESRLKRKAGVKDSGSIIPGHGGFMDRMDGLVFAAVVVWLVCVATSGVDEPALALFWNDRLG